MQRRPESRRDGVLDRTSRVGVVEVGDFLPPNAPFRSAPALAML